MNNKDAQEEINKNIQQNALIITSNKEMISDLNQQGYKSIVEPDGNLRFIKVRQLDEMCNTSFQAPYNFFLDEKSFDNFFNHIK